MQNAALRYRKRALSYITFADGSNDATLTTDVTFAALFYFNSDGDLMTGGLFILVDSNLPYIAFQKSTTRPDNIGSWQIDANGALIFTDVDGFCVTIDTSVFIIISGGVGPVGCVNISLAIDGMLYLHQSKSIISVLTLF